MSDTDKYSPITPFIIALMFVVAAWFLNLFLLSVRPEFTESWIFLGDRGSFGDQFGAVNAAFSGLAFCGVVYAVFLQRHEIRIAREEIRQTKKILDKQQDQLELQNLETRKQAFENTFFQLLRLFTDITSQIDLRAGDRITKGKDVFPVFFARIKAKYSDLQDRVRTGKLPNGADTPKAAYENFYKDHNSELGHYFRTIYNIVKFIDGSDVKDKKFYSNILRAQLSDAEINLLFHNGLSGYGREKFKPLIEKYGLLKNFERAAALEPSLLREYAESAYGRKVG